MGKVNWTEEQKQAINEKGSNTLVAAAAGSGKTAVLVERMIHKIIDEKIDIDRLLVVTFTNAAASEMRERVLEAIYQKIEEEPENVNLQRQITLLNKASICTIDSFCLEVVRNNFYELENISPNFRIGDTTEIELLKQEVIEELFEKKYEEENEEFRKLLTTYTSYKDDTPLKEMILKIDSYIQSSPFPKKWITEKIEMFHLEGTESDFSKTIWGEVLLQEIEEELIDDISALQEVETSLATEPELENFWQTIRDDIDKLMCLKKQLHSWDESYQIAQNLKFTTWPRKKVESKLKEQAKEVRDELKKKITKKLDKIFIGPSKEVNQDIRNMYEILDKLKNIILEFEEEFTKRKREKNLVDFSDIEHLALSILWKEKPDGEIEKTETAKRYQEKFEEIAIDEYQDSNLVQEYILTAVAKENNLFMVGDVKQSIYKFRQAMPELFLNKYASYQKKEEKNQEEGLKIQLFKNFRSRDNVLQFTNLIFDSIMSTTLGDINYNEEEYLNLGAEYPETEQNLKTEIYVINTKEEEALIQEENEEINEEIEERIENIELEAKLVANKIEKLIEEKFQVWDRKKNTFRDIQYKDIVILLRATSKAAPVFEQELLSLEIPVFSDSSQEYLDSIEIQTVMSLLKVIDNPMQDIPLVTVLRSPIGKFTDDELVQIRLTDQYDNFYQCLQKAKVDVNETIKKKIENMINQLNMWREEQEYLALDELIWKIYSDTGYYHYVGLMPNGELRQANLKMLFERAKQYETASFKGLYNFIHFIERLRLGSGDLGAAKIIGENDNVVRIMSIHKSKGLEFPVVFLSHTGKQFNLMDLNKNILLHQEMGMGVKYIDYEKQVQYDTLSKVAIQSKVLTETLSEEMRILYVALTRAKEKLFITGLSKDYEKEIEKMQKLVNRYERSNNKINPILLKKYKKYIDWMLLTYLYEQNKIKDTVDLKIYSKQEVLQFCRKVEKQQIDVLKLLEEQEKQEDRLQEIETILNYQYPHQLATKIPTKASVSELKQLQEKKREENNLNEKVKTKKETEKEKEDEKKERNSKFPIPNFMRQEEEKIITAAEKGTLIHLCMQQLDETKEYDLEKVKELIEGLKRKEIINEKEAESINPYKILEFTKSNTWKELKEAKEIYKEQPFYLHLPAKEIYGEEAKEIKEEIIVQGIIDLYYIDKNDNLVLLDYKTDYVEPGKEHELFHKYKKQLELYQEALEEAFNKKVDKISIYSVYLGKEILENSGKI